MSIYLIDCSVLIVIVINAIPNPVNHGEVRPAVIDRGANNDDIEMGEPEIEDAEMGEPIEDAEMGELGAEDIEMDEPDIEDVEMAVVKMGQPEIEDAEMGEPEAEDAEVEDVEMAVYV